MVCLFCNGTGVVCWYGTLQKLNWRTVRWYGTVQGAKYVIRQFWTYRSALPSLIAAFAFADHDQFFHATTLPPLSNGLTLTNWLLCFYFLNIYCYKCNSCNCFVQNRKRLCATSRSGQIAYKTMFMNVILSVRKTKICVLEKSNIICSLNFSQLFGVLITQMLVLF